MNRQPRTPRPPRQAIERTPRRGNGQYAAYDLEEVVTHENKRRASTWAMMDQYEQWVKEHDHGLIEVEEQTWVKKSEEEERRRAS